MTKRRGDERRRCLVLLLLFLPYYLLSRQKLVWRPLSRQKSPALASSSLPPKKGLRLRHACVILSPAKNVAYGTPDRRDLSSTTKLLTRGNRFHPYTWHRSAGDGRHSRSLDISISRLLPHSSSSPQLELAVAHVKNSLRRRRIKSRTQSID